MSSGWITKEDVASGSSSSQQQGTNDLASRLGGFGLQDKTNGGSQAAATPPGNGSTAPTAASSDKPQTVPDGWSTPAAASSSSTSAAPVTTNVAEGAQATAAPANGDSSNQDDLAAAEKEAQEMSHEDGEACMKRNGFIATSIMLYSLRDAIRCRTFMSVSRKVHCADCLMLNSSRSRDAVL